MVNPHVEKREKTEISVFPKNGVFRPLTRDAPCKAWHGEVLLRMVWHGTANLGRSRHGMSWRSDSHGDMHGMAWHDRGCDFLRTTAELTMTVTVTVNCSPLYPP